MKHVLTALIAATVVLAACGGAAATPSPAATATSITAATVAPAATSTETTTTAAATTKVSANNATAAQLQSAFEAAGVPNASRWVIEVQEYRPYPTDDPSFAKLKSNLAKYNPSADTLTRILGALTLP
jgi:ABC-type glycerol-3-phosphate transport system substrate-binding protein